MLHPERCFFESSVEWSFTKITSSTHSEISCNERTHATSASSTERQSSLIFRKGTTIVILEEVSFTKQITFETQSKFI